MADSDLPGLTALTGANLASGDLAHVVDVSDTTYAADGTDKKMTIAELIIGLAALGLQPLDADLTALAAAANSSVLAATTASFLIADESKLDGIEAAADVTDATNVNAAGAVMESDYDANTVLAATSDNTPVALTVGEQTLVGRITSGAIAALSAAQVRTLLDVPTNAEAVLDALYDAHTIVYATSDNTPAALTVSEETVVGRQTGGNIAAVNPSAIAQQINTQTDSYTLVLGDRGKIVEMNKGTACTLTVPPNSSVAFPTGTRIDVVQYGAGACTLTPGLGVTIRVNALLTLVTNGAYAGCTLYKRGTDEWVAIGDLVAA